mmetsp:Transcript_4592/g.6515  ORF Transcript_4592/g.6515 Transcript_4592/m.6515 type:complete len:636 (+) Transcript_4592:185-2092(+)
MYLQSINIPNVCTIDENCISIDETKSSDGNSRNSTSITNQDEEGECTLFLATSGIPNSGFGMYTTRHIPKDESVLNYADSPSIVVLDSTLHNGGKDIHWNHGDYFWAGTGLAEFEADSVEENVVTFGALANYHTFLSNVEGDFVEYEDDTLDRFKDPGAGAYSYFRGHKYRATKDIPAGEEIFANYGENWFDTREGTYADMVPRFQDFHDVAAILSVLTRNVQIKQLEINESVLSTVKDVVIILDKRKATLLPTNMESFSKLTMTRDQRLPAKRIADTTVIKHDIAWIKENGLCLDKVRPGRSTIYQAGGGAFATRLIKEGSMVIPAPLLNIVDRAELLMYPLEYDEEKDEMVQTYGEDEDKEPVGEQIMTNYCFGHTKSSLLLCPQTAALLINHCSSRMDFGGSCGDNVGPNAEIRWGTSWDKKTSYWLKFSMENMKKQIINGMKGLSFEVIATRDILPGEEIFIDYGLDWENAWKDHLASWEPPKKDGGWDNHTPIRRMKKEDLRTTEEQKENPYPENVQFVCFYNGDEEEEDEEEEDSDAEYEESGKEYISDDILVENTVFPCDLETLDKASGSATVYIPSKRLTLKDYPTVSILFRQRQYTSDQHLPKAFRHPIGIDDSLFPDQWKNLDGI